jgi:hypothetical protein
MHHMCETWSQHTWCLCSRPDFGPLKPGCDRRLGAWFLHGEGSFSGYPPFPVPIVRERKRGKRKRIRNRMTWRTFLTRSLWRRRSVACFPGQRRRLSRREVNATGHAARGAAVARARAVRGTAVSLLVFESRGRSMRNVERVSPWSLYTRGRVWRWFFASLLASLLGFRNLRDLSREKETAHPVLYAATPSAR